MLVLTSCWGRRLNFVDHLLLQVIYGADRILLLLDDVVKFFLLVCDLVIKYANQLILLRQLFLNLVEQYNVALELS